MIGSRCLAVLLPLALLLAGLTAPQPKAEETASGEVVMTLTSVAAGIGFEWGSGKLTMADGRERKFKISGLSVIDVGIKSAQAKGPVFRLQRMSDFVGSYTAAQAGLAVAVGASGQTMTNENGVVVDLTAVQGGIKFSLGPKGMTVEWAE